MTNVHEHIHTNFPSPEFGDQPPSTPEMPLYDPLTRLKNRQWLEENLPHMLEEDDGSVGLLFIDLDNLSAVNNTKGHEAGNDLIKTTANTLGSVLRVPTVPGEDPDRPYDIVRYAGDEFVVIVRGISLKSDLETVTSRVSGALFEAGASASTGATLYEKGESIKEFLTRGSVAMQQVKHERKLRKYPHEAQRMAARQIGAIAAEHGLDLRDLRALLEALE